MERLDGIKKDKKKSDEKIELLVSVEGQQIGRTRTPRRGRRPQADTSSHCKFPSHPFRPSL